MGNLLEFFRKNDIGEPPWDYNFLVNLDEKEYPKYLAKIFKYRTGEKLPLKYDFKNNAWIIDKKRCKTFNQKIQWLKLYGVTDLMRQCTDKVAVRDYVKEKIGEEYLKPVLQIIPDDSQESSHVIANHNSILGGEAIQQIVNEHFNQLDCHADTKMSLSARNDGKINDVSTYFDQINWKNLPNSFVIKTNHGSKWQYIIKDKEEFLNTPQLFEIVKRNITGWLEQEYFPWNGFEMQYKGIMPKILIEPLMRDEINMEPETINVYCFNGTPKITFYFYDNSYETIYDENLNEIEKIFISTEELSRRKASDLIKQSFSLFIKLSKNFNFVRIDWMLCNNTLYFEELTFSPFSGFHLFKNKQISLTFGKLI